VTFAAVACLVCEFIGGGRRQHFLCAMVAAGPASPAQGAPPASLSLPDPDLARFEKVIQEQLREARARLLAPAQNSASAKSDLAQLYGQLGKLYQTYDLKDAALTCYLKAQTLDPTAFAWRYYSGYIYQANGDPQTAVLHFQNALQIRPDDLATLVRVAQAYTDLNQTELAKPIFEKVLRLDKSCVPALVGLGKFALSGNDYKGAVELFQEALALDPKASSIEYQLAMAYRRLGNLSQAQAHLLRQGSRQPQMPDSLIEELEGLKKGKAALWRRGARAINGGRVAEAVKDFRELVTLDPEDATSRMYLGIALARAGDGKQAIEQYSEALQRAPGNAGVHYNLGVVLAERGAVEQAVEHLQAALRSDSQMTKAHFQLANLLMRLGHYAEAPSEYAAVVRMEPRNAFARLMEAMALVRLKNYSAARDKLEQAVTAVPGDSDLKTALARLLAACPEESVRDGPRALQMIQQVMSNEKSFDLEQGQALAMALAAIGQFQEAAKIQRFMIAELERAGQVDLARLLRANLTSYERDQPCLIPWRDDDPIFSPVPGKMGVSAELSAPALLGEDLSK